MGVPYQFGDTIQYNSAGDAIRGVPLSELTLIKYDNAQVEFHFADGFMIRMGNNSLNYYNLPS